MRGTVRSAAAIPLVCAVVAVAASCAPTPPPIGQVPNPARWEVVPADWGAGRDADIRDVPYVPDGYAGCGSAAVTRIFCRGSQTLDVYRHDPAGAPARGTIVFLHGGGFTSGDKSDKVGLTGPVLSQTARGWDVVSVNYRLNQDGFAPWPAAIEDVEAAIGWIRTNGRDVGVTPERIVTAGHSAGGTLATLAGVAWNTADPAYASVTRIDGWVDLAGITDFRISNGSIWGTPWWGSALALAERTSPVSHVDAEDPPGHVIHGDSDGIVSVANAHLLKAAADRSGARVSLDVVDAWMELTWMPPTFRDHLPGGGANMAAFNGFLDGI